jgi:hypothetical protein
MEAVGIIGLVVLLLLVVVGIPMLCRMAIRRMAASQGFRGFLNAYGPPRVPGLFGGDEPDDKPDA